jgi:uncharacterized protein YcbK (DUF882 family)
MNRRELLKVGGTGLALSALGIPVAHAARASRTPVQASGARLLSFVNTHTGDTFADAYWENGDYISDAMNAIKRVMRDHRSGEEHDIDPRLLDQLTDLRGVTGSRQPYQIISGYRSPVTNAAMHEQSSGVATRSLHMEGRAIDIRVEGVELARLRDAALGLQRGGVGFYPGASNNFIHVDTGRVRRW